MEKELIIFGYKHSYHFSYEVERDIAVLKRLYDAIGEWHILCYTGYESVDFYISNDRLLIGYGCINWIYEENKTAECPYIRETLLSCATEDVEWTKWRNEGLTGIFYRKIRFDEDVQEMVRSQIKEYLSITEQFYSELKEAEDERKRLAEKRQKEWERVATYRNIKPYGGEGGQDGYIDADYYSPVYGTIRMVDRDVFDFGTYAYPKRCEGKDDALNRENWTEGEKDLANWLAQFGFTGIRM